MGSIKKDNILFFGGSSLLANMWYEFIDDKSKVFLTEHNQKVLRKGSNIINIDKITLLNIKDILEKFKISILINCVGLTNVEKCETNHSESEYLNSIVPLLLAKACIAVNVKLIHISTDHIFDGRKSFYRELDNPNPLNQYAKSKLMGENNVLKENKSSLIIRTNFFGNGPNYRKSFSDEIRLKTNANLNIYLFDDVFYTPIIINEFSRIIKLLLLKNKKGIYNVVSNERITKYQFGMMLEKNLKLKKGFIKKGYLTKREDLIIRPVDMSLSNSKIIQELGIKILPLDKQIDLLA